MTEKISEESQYAIKFLDNGGVFKTFSKRHQKIRDAIMKESKRRMMVRIRYAINKSPKIKRMIYKKIKNKSDRKMEPGELYESLEVLSYETLININKTISHDSK